MNWFQPSLHKGERKNKHMPCLVAIILHLSLFWAADWYWKKWGVQCMHQIAKCMIIAWVVFVPWITCNYNILTTNSAHSPNATHVVNRELSHRMNFWPFFNTGYKVHANKQPATFKQNMSPRPTQYKDRIRTSTKSLTSPILTNCTLSTVALVTILRFHTGRTRRPTYRYSPLWRWEYCMLPVLTVGSAVVRDRFCCGTLLVWMWAYGVDTTAGLNAETCQ